MPRDTRGRTHSISFSPHRPPVAGVTSYLKVPTCLRLRHEQSLSRWRKGRRLANPGGLDDVRFNAAQHAGRKRLLRSRLQQAATRGSRHTLPRGVIPPAQPAGRRRAGAVRRLRALAHRGQSPAACRVSPLRGRGRPGRPPQPHDSRTGGTRYRGHRHLPPGLRWPDRRALGRAARSYAVVWFGQADDKSQMTVCP